MLAFLAMWQWALVIGFAVIIIVLLIIRKKQQQY